MQAQEEIIFAISLPADIRAATVFNAVKKFYEKKKIPMQNILQCPTDGAAAMARKHQGFIPSIKRKYLDSLQLNELSTGSIWSPISAELHNSLHIVIKYANKIKVYSLNDRLFRALCHDNEDFEHHLLHTAVRWLSKGACMTHFYSLYDFVIEFLYGIDCQLAEAVKPLKNDIAYLADIFALMNEVNKKLVGEMIMLIRCKSVITSFISKLSLYRENIG